jgi:hypothetical protein
MALRAIHVPRRFNILADAISRNSLGLLFQGLARAPNARRPMRPELLMLLIRDCSPVPDTKPIEAHPQRWHYSLTQPDFAELALRAPYFSSWTFSHLIAASVVWKKLSVLM